MKIMKHLLYFAMISLFFMTGCEEKAVIIPEFTTIVTGKTVYVEELTGVRCPNCPAGSARLESISALFPDNMIVVGIHGTDLTKPLDESKYDFRNEDAIALENHLKSFLGKPSAYFNRVRFPELLGDFGNPFNGQWQGYVERELEKDQVLELSMVKTFDPITRILEVQVSALPLVDLAGEHSLTILLTEGNIIDAQDDQNEIILEYNHKHVLRDVITAFDGDAFGNDLEKNTLITKKYTYTVPTDDTDLWNVDNIEVVAFVANTTGESEEVIQAVQEHLMD